MKSDASVFSHYDLLGVSQTASEEEIRDAENSLRRLFERAAYDNKADANEMLRKLLEAHEVLLDRERKLEYDKRRDVLARSYVDVAYPLPVGRYAKLAQVAGWLDEEETWR